MIEVPAYLNSEEQSRMPFLIPADRQRGGIKIEYHYHRRWRLILKDYSSPFFLSINRRKRHSKRKGDAEMEPMGRVI